MAGEQRTAKVWMTSVTVLWVVLGLAVIGLILWWSGVLDNTSDSNGNGDPDRETVFTTDQAERGQEEYSSNCAECHGGQLDGDPPLSGDSFAATWEGMPVNALFEVISQTMPQDNPGSLSDETYADITAHILAFNGMPEGDDELSPGDDRALQALIGFNGAAEDDAAADDSEASEDDAAADDSEAAESEESAEDNGTAEDSESAGTEDAGTEEEGSADASDASDDAEGRFTEEQAEAGAEAYSASCASCHGEDGTGGSDPPLADGALGGRFETVWELFEYTSTEMPDDAPGSLDEQTYVDIVAHLLALNGHSAGEEELEADEESMADMQLQVANGQESAGGDGEGGAADEESDVTQIETEEPGEGEEPGAGEGWIEFTVQPSQATINILGPSGYVGQITGHEGGGTITGLQPGPYILVASLGNFDHQVVAEVRQNETSRVDLTVSELASSRDLAGSNGHSPESEGTNDTAAQNGEDAEGGPDAENGATDTSESDDSAGGETWFSEEQAEAGAEEYSASCASCHGEDGTGGSDPPLADGALEGRFETVWELFEYTSTEMPDDAPGSLDEETYVDIVAHLLALNGHPAGDEELEADEESMSGMQLGGADSNADTGADEQSDADESPEEQQDAQSQNEQTAAARGQSAYSSNCAMCHGPSLEGIEAPPLAGPVFMERWGGHPVDWLYFQAYTSMPPDSPGSLEDQVYTDIVVYILTENGLLEGDEEFRPHDPLLEMMIIGDQGQQDFTLEHRIDELRRTIHEPFEEVEQDDPEAGADETGIPDAGPGISEDQEDVNGDQADESDESDEGDEGNGGNGE